MDYKRKALIVEAERYFAGASLPQGVKLGNIGAGLTEAYCLTPNGCISVRSGDWIVRDPIDGHFYPVAPNIFEQTYDAVV